MSYLRNTVAVVVWSEEFDLQARTCFTLQLIYRNASSTLNYNYICNFNSLSAFPWAIFPTCSSESSIAFKNSIPISFVLKG